MANIRMRELILLISVIDAVCGACPVSKDLKKNDDGAFKLSGQIMCGKEPEHGAYVQIADGFQSVNDILSHGHTDLGGNFETSGSFFFYSDNDLAAPEGRWFIKVYSYCGMKMHNTNQCHRLTQFETSCKESNLCKDGCLSEPKTGDVITMVRNGLVIDDTKLMESQAGITDRIICLDRTVRESLTD